MQLNKECVILVSVKDNQEGERDFTTELLNSTEIADLLPYELKLSNKTMIMPMCVLDNRV